MANPFRLPDPDRPLPPAKTSAEYVARMVAARRRHARQGMRVGLSVEDAVNLAEAQARDQIQAARSGEQPKIFLSPPRQQWLELPLNFKRIWDAVPQVDAALGQMQWGLFNQPALLADAMIADDRINGVFATRTNALLGSPFDLTLGPENERAPVSPDQARCNLLVKRLWSIMFPKPSLAALLRWGLLLGVGLGELVWRRIPNNGLIPNGLPFLNIPRLKIWHPQNLTWRWDTRSYWLVTQDGYIEIQPGNGQWIVFAPYRHHYGWVDALINPLAKLWLQRQFAYRDWGRWSEVHGLGIKKGFVPQDAKKEDKEAFLEILSDMPSETTVLCPVVNKDERFDIEFANVKEGTDWQGFAGQIDHLNGDIAIVVNGQNLTTEVKGGSRAAAQVHETVRGDFKRSDAQTLGECLRDQGVRWVVRYNYGASRRVITPMPSWEVDPKNDAKFEADVAVAVSSAAANFKNAGAPVDMKRFLQQHNVPVLEPEEDAAAAEGIQIDATDLPMAEDPSPAGSPGHLSPFDHQDDDTGESTVTRASPGPGGEPEDEVGP